MGERPSHDHSIDRINVNGNYEPSNCRWATKMEQSRNTRKNVKVEMNGIIKCISEWAKEYNIPQSTLLRRYRKYGNLEIAVKVKNNCRKIVEIEGEFISWKSAEVKLGFRRGALQNRLRKGMSIGDAIKLPYLKYSKKNNGSISKQLINKS